MLFKPMRKTMKPRFIFTVVLSLFAIHSFAANGSMKGDGSATSPFQIEDYEDLKAIGKGAYLYSSDYVLTKDIDASASKNEMCNEDGCNGFISIGKYKDAADSIIFWGNIDGQNHTISDLTIWLPCENDVAFISYLGGSVSNLKFDRIHVTGRVTESNFVASVAAKQMGTIRNVHVTNGFVQGQNYVGGIVGEGTRRYDENAIIDSVSFQGDIKGSQRVGGIVGETDMDVLRAETDVNIVVMDQDAGGIVGYLTGHVFQSRSSGTITPDAYEVDEVGGIAGYSKGGISECVSTMDLIRSGSFYLDESIGGIVGEGGLVSASYALGTVEGKRYVGGIAGNGAVEYSYAMGTVHGSEYVGGLVGYGTVRNSYAANIVQGDSRVGGLIGMAADTVVSSYWNTDISGLDTSAGGTGLTTAKMMKFSSFAGWDTLGYNEYVIDGTDTCDYYKDFGVCYSPTGKFIRHWAIDEGKSFPYLANHPFLKKTLVPIAVPTVAAKWQEIPVVASLMKVDGELVGKWLGWAKPNMPGDPIERDSLYYGYRIGVVAGKDTIWGTSSYMAVPNKIEISSFEELQKIGNDIAYPLTANYELIKDIDASGSNFKPIGDGVHAFSGMFDGKNHTISNLTIDEPNRDFTGMFGYTQMARIKNLTLKNAKVTGSWYVGALGGEMKRTVVKNVVSLNGDIVGDSYVGGLIGSAREDSIEVVATTGNVTGVEGVGGLIGASSSVLRDAFAIDVVKGHEPVAGAIAHMQHFDITPVVERVYSASMLKAFKASGIIASDFWWSGDPEYCFFDSTVAKIASGGLSTNAMLKKATYETFDFENVWEIQEGKSYPYFKGMDPMLPGMLKDDGKVNVLAGFGTEKSPYEISTYEDLKLIGKHEYATNLYYKLSGNINAYASLNENCNAGVCKGFEPIPEFSGTFIGGGRIIGNLNINRPDEDSVGLFRVLTSTAKVTGIVVDSSSNFTGDNFDTQRKTFKPIIRGKNNVGAIAGVDEGAVLDSIFIHVNMFGANDVGAIVGAKNGGTIQRSASKGTVEGGDNVGGLAGDLNKVTVSDCYSLAYVSGTKNVGGLVGYAKSATVSNSFAANNVKGSSKWGNLVGDVSGSTFTSVYGDSTAWFVNVTAAGDLRGTWDMVRKENYKNWNFAKTWNMLADSTYPYLVWKKDPLYADIYKDSTLMRMTGSGTEKDPFLVKTYADLKSIGWGKYKLSAVYRIANDIDASASQTETFRNGYGKGFKPIGKYLLLNENYLVNDSKQDTSAFSGKIHGGGHVIKDLNVGYVDYLKYWTGFIDGIASSGLVDSLSFTGYSINGKNVGGVTAKNEGTLRDVSISGQLKAEESGGGLVVWNEGTIENSSFKGTILSTEKYISAYDYPLAGIATRNNGKIKNVNVDAEIKSVYGGAGVSYDNAGSIEKSNVLVKMDVGSDYAGGVAAKNFGTVSVCSASVEIVSKASYVGGIAGIDSGLVETSTATGSISAVDYAGGLIGAARGKSITNAHASVNVSGKKWIGGLVGENNVHISRSYATGNVRGARREGEEYLFANAYYAGGLVGLNNASIDSSYTTGEYSYASGFVGMNLSKISTSYTLGRVKDGDGFAGVNKGTIANSYCAGEQTYGGFVGENRNGGVILNSYIVTGNQFASWNYVNSTIENCYMLGASDQRIAGNEGTIKDSSRIGYGFSDSEMKKQATFEGFNFDSVWYIKEGVSYPMLRGMPNIPFAVEAEMNFGESMRVKDVRESLLDHAFVMDSSYAKVVKFASVSEKLLDSLEKVEGKAVGEFVISYRVGMLFGQDTIWSSLAQAKINLSGKTTDIRAYELATKSGLRFGAVFQDCNIAVHFEIPAAAAVKFSLVDMQGRVVRAFNLGNRTAGTHFETRSVENLPRGRYVGVLQVNGRATEKTMLLKK